MTGGSIDGVNTGLAPSIQSQPIETNENTENVGHAPEELRAPKSGLWSVLKTIGRVALGVVTLGISEGIIYAIGRAKAQPAPAPRIAVQENPLDAQKARTDRFNSERKNLLLSSNWNENNEILNAVDQGLDGIDDGDDLNWDKLRNDPLVKRKVEELFSQCETSVTPEKIRDIVKEAATLKNSMDKISRGLEYNFTESNKEAIQLMLSHIQKNYNTEQIEDFAKNFSDYEFEKFPDELQKDLRTVDTLYKKADEQIENMLNDIGDKFPKHSTDILFLSHSLIVDNFLKLCPIDSHIKNDNGIQDFEQAFSEQIERCKENINSNLSKMDELGMRQSDVPVLFRTIFENPSSIRPELIDVLHDIVENDEVNDNAFEKLRDNLTDRDVITSGEFDEKYVSERVDDLINLVDNPNSQLSLSDKKLLLTCVVQNLSLLCNNSLDNLSSISSKLAGPARRMIGNMSGDEINPLKRHVLAMFTKFNKMPALVNMNQI